MKRILAICILFILPLATQSQAYTPRCWINKQITEPYNFISSGINPCAYLLTASVGSKVSVQCRYKLANQNICTDKFMYSTIGNFSLDYFYNCGGNGVSYSIDITSASNKLGVVGNFVTPNSAFSCMAYIPTPEGKCDCGWRFQNRITGGSVTGINEYPFMSYLVSPTGVLIGGSVIISNKHALTTISTISGYIVGYLFVGDHNLIDREETAGYNQYVVANVITHPNYNEASFQHDIAIVVTRTQIHFSLTVGPVCLPYGNLRFNQFVNYPVVALGWGGDRAGVDYTVVLRAANFSVISEADCKKQLFLNDIGSNQICSASSINSICKNDAGGPLVTWNSSTNRYVLVGLISFGLLCQPLIPSVHTRITSFLPWIESHTAGTTFCKK